MRYFLKLYKTTVTGQFFCRYHSHGYYTVSVQQRSLLYKDTNPLNVTRVPYGSAFSLKAKLQSYARPNLYVKIVHDCSPPNHPCHKLFTRDIAKNFVRNKYSKKLLAKESYDMGTSDLLTHKSIYLKCYRKRGSI